MEFCTDMVNALKVRREAKDWSQFEVKRVEGKPRVGVGRTDHVPSHALVQKRADRFC